MIPKLFLSGIFVYFSFFAFSQDLETIKQQSPFKVKGSLNAKLQFYDSDKEKPNRDPFVWYLQGNPEISMYGIVLPFSFRLSEQDRDFTQPFNQFGVSPYYKWIKAHLGYRSLNWSNFALAGHSFSGAGLELTPGKFRVGFVTGRLLKPVKYDNNPDYTSAQALAYRRTGSAFIFGYGTEKNYANLVVLKARDDENSLDTIPEGYMLTPSENLVISLSTKQVIATNFIFDLEIAQSLFIKDTRATIPDSALDFMGKTFSFLMRNQGASFSHNALQTSIGYQSDVFALKAKYQRIEPDFTSMGAYYFLTDISSFTIEPSVKLFKKKLSVGGSFGTQTDNLGNDKSLQTRRTITSAKVNYVPLPQLNISAFFSNYDLAQQSGILSIDTLRESEVAQATSQFGFNSSYALSKENWSHNLMVSFNGQKLNDRNSNTSENTEFSTLILTSGYFATYMPWNINGSVSYMYTSLTRDTVTTVVAGPVISIGKSFLKNKMNVSLSYSAMTNRVSKETTNIIGNISMQLMYKPVKNHRFSLRYYNNTNDGKNTLYSSYYENKLDVDYTYTF